jgi:branched-chain amino acid transport system ATP-binding protein
VLKLEGISSGYGEFTVLNGVSLEVEPGEVVALIGANGAGKTTMLRTISGFLRPKAGDIYLDGEAISGLGPHRIVRRGLVQVPEGRHLFGNLTVLENLRMGGYTRSSEEHREAFEEVYAMFPILKERGGQIASTMSGGQQQMLAIGRALMVRPRLLMLDEPSLGLDPKTTASVFDAVRRISETGIAILIVEQNAVRTLRLADRAYVLESGEVKLEGTGEELLDDPRVRAAYLGL